MCIIIIISGINRLLHERHMKSKSYLSLQYKVKIKPVVQRMVKAYILIKATVGKEESVLKEILGLSVTEEAHKVFGPYDIVAEVRGRDMETLIEIITEKVERSMELKTLNQSW